MRSSHAGALATTAKTVDAARVTSEHLELVDLLNDVETLSQLLAHEVVAASRDSSDTEHMLDAFLLAAGMSQVVEDNLGDSRHEGGASVVSFAVGLNALVDGLADRVMGVHSASQQAWWDNLLESARRVRTDAAALPCTLRSAVLRLPDCFRSFDQEPADCAALALRFSEHAPDRGQPLAVVGVRTSGSYLAPLVAASLRKLGYERVTATSLRPGVRPNASANRALRETAAASGTALLVDDPPVTGGKLAQAAGDVASVGFPPDRIALLIALLGAEESLPEQLRLHTVIPLPWTDWEVNRRLDAAAVRGELRDIVEDPQASLISSAALGGLSVADVERLPLDPIDDVVARPLVRSHVRAQYRVLFARDGGSTRVTRDVYAKGTGLGYFGRHSWVLSTRLRGHIPTALGWRHGLLYRVASRESERAISAPPSEQSLVAAVVDYALARQQHLAIDRDRTLDLRGRDCAWEMLAGILTANHGRMQRLTRPVLRRVTRATLAGAMPMVVDGSMSLCHWFSDPQSAGSGHLIKADYDERAFSVWDAYSCDIVRDLAAASADAKVRAARCALPGALEPACADAWLRVGLLLRTEYERRSGQRVASERWFLYELLALQATLWHLQRLRVQGPGQLQSRDGTPYPSPSVSIAGFGGAVAAEAEAVEQTLARLRSEYAAAALHRAADRGKPERQWRRAARLLRLALRASEQRRLARLATCGQLVASDAVATLWTLVVSARKR